MKLRGIVLAGAALAMPFGIVAVEVVGQGPAGAVTKVTFAGTLKCTVTGSFTFNPPLLFTTGSTTTVTEKSSLKANSAACTASKGLTQKGATLASMAYSSTVVFPVGTDCLSLESAGNTGSTAKVSYKSTAPTSFTIGQSTINWSGYTQSTNSAGNITIALPNSGGTSPTTGSFKGNSTGALVSDSTESALLNACNSSKGLSKIAFTGKGGPSTLTVG